MIRVFLAMVLGGLLGALVDPVLGAALGVLVGLVLGLGWNAVRTRTTKVPAWLPTQRKSERVVCVPKGEPADCEVVRDARTGKVLDVVRCSLATDPDKVRCPKQCVTMLQDAKA